MSSAPMPGRPWSFVFLPVMRPGEGLVVLGGAVGVIPAVPAIPVSHKGTSLDLAAYCTIPWHDDPFQGTFESLPR